MLATGCGNVAILSGKPDGVLRQVTVASSGQDLPAALSALDAAFAPLNDGPFTVGGCTHCYAQADLDALAGPVDRVPEDLIPHVAHEGPDHWADFPALYRRMTPRIIRSMVTGNLHGDYGLLAQRLLDAGWRSWPAAERKALDQVWHAWWRSALDQYPGTGRATDVLEVIAVSTGTLVPWLASWRATRTEAADRHLHDALRRWLRGGDLADLRLGFYGNFRASAELVPWLLSLEEGRISAALRAEVERIAVR